MIRRRYVRGWRNSAKLVLLEISNSTKAFPLFAFRSMRLLLFYSPTNQNFVDWNGDSCSGAGPPAVVVVVVVVVEVVTLR